LVRCGFRESGLVITDKRVTVAIRSYGLSLTVPWSRSHGHPLRPTQTYLKALTQDANRRLQTNLKRLEAFHVAIENGLFRSTFPSSKCQQVTDIQSLPNLNLHSHTAVAVVNCADNNDSRCLDLLVFGGYGTGPNDDDSGNSNICQRNDHVYCVHHERTSNDQQQQPLQWHSVDILKPPTNNTACTQSNKFDDDDKPLLLSFRDGRILVDPVDNNWRASYQGMTAASLRNDNGSLILLFGGRQGPAKPTNNLWLFDYNASKQCGCFYQPRCVIQGNTNNNKLPSPRWGHALTRLVQPPSSRQQQSSTAPRFLLTGGRGEHGTCPDSIYLLSMVMENNGGNNSNSYSKPSYQFLWEPLFPWRDSPDTAACRFHHSAVALDSNHVFVFGGLFDAEDLLEAFAIDDSNVDDNNDAVDAILLSLNHHQPNETLPLSVNVEQVQLPSNVSPRFGHAACAFSMPDSQSIVNVLLSGCVCRQQKGAKDSDQGAALQMLQFIQDTQAKNGKKFKVTSQPLSWKQGFPIDVGVLVHHSCVALPQCSDQSIDVALVGGGVFGFAFQQCFAPSFILTFDMGVESRNGRADEPKNHTTGIIFKPRVQSSQSHNGNAVTISPTCDVLYVEKQNAKKLKTALEESLFLNKEYRMTSVDKAGIQSISDACRDTDMSLLIAVPVHSECIDLYVRKEEKQPHWTCLAAGYGHQACPRSSGSFAQGTKSKR